jgi:chromosome segregation ATPase
VENQTVINQKLEEFKEIDQEKNRVIEERAKMDAKMQSLMNEIEETEKAIEALAHNIDNESLRTENLSSRIVENPEVYVKQVQERKEKYKELNLVKESTKESAGAVRVSESRMEHIIGLIREVSVLLDTIDKTSAKYKELCKTLENYKQERFVLDKDVYEANTEIKALEIGCDRVNSMNEDAKNNNEARITQIAASMDAKRNELEYVAKQKAELSLELNEKKRACESLQQQWKMMEDKHFGVMKQLREEHEKTVDKAQNYARKIVEYLKAAEGIKVLSGGVQFEIQ